MPPKNGMREILREELDTLALSANALSKALDVPVNRITAILHGHRAVTAARSGIAAVVTATVLAVAVAGVRRRHWRTVRTWNGFLIEGGIGSITYAGTGHMGVHIMPRNQPPFSSNPPTGAAAQMVDPLRGLFSATG